MANLHIKGIDEETYVYIKKMAAAENRSVSQQILFLVKKYLATRGGRHPEKTATQTLFELSDSWDDDRSAESIISECCCRSRKIGYIEETTTETCA